MSTDLKAMVIVLSIASVIFRFAKPVALQFGSSPDFERRRNVWLILTAASFASPNFWLFALVATPLLFWAGRRDSNPLALYLLLVQLIPDLYVDIPLPGFNRLFSIDFYRVLSLCVLVPAVWRFRSGCIPSGFRTGCILLIAYGLLQTLLFIYDEAPGQVALYKPSLTDDLRRAFLFAIDAVALYVIASRSCRERRMMVEALSAFCLACVVMAAVGIFESWRHWLLYADLRPRWGDVGASAGFYYMRGGALRAAASSGQPLVLGYLITLGLGTWLYLKTQVKSNALRTSVTGLLCGGLYVTYSRGSWVGAVVTFFAFTALRPRMISHLSRAVLTSSLIGIVVLASPLGGRIVNMIPFLGGRIDSESYTYRQNLAARCWQLIQNHPLLGDQHALSKLEDFRQGEGIIDLVNTYAQVTLYYGFVGVMLFLSVMLLSFALLAGATRRAGRSDADLGQLGAAIGACVVGTLMMLAGSSFVGGYAQMFYILSGLGIAYAQLQPTQT